MAFELRANVAIRILVERVELEHHPHLTLDGHSARRTAWQAIAGAAVEQLIDSPPAAVTHRKSRKRRKLKAAAETSAADTHTHTCTHCQRRYTPLPQHRARSKYCTRLECQKVRRAAASKRKALKAGAA